VRPEGLGKLEKNPPHWDAIPRPSGLQHSASTTMLLRAPSLPQWDIKIPWIFKFVTAVFSFIILAPFLKFNFSTMCRYKIMKQKVSESPIIRVQISIFSIT
jgi:hypothetical protein